MGAGFALLKGERPGDTVAHFPLGLGPLLLQLPWGLPVMRFKGWKMALSHIPVIRALHVQGLSCCFVANFVLNRHQCQTREVKSPRLQARHGLLGGASGQEFSYRIPARAKPGATAEWLGRRAWGGPGCCHCCLGGGKVLCLTYGCCTWAAMIWAWPKKALIVQALMDCKVIQQRCPGVHIVWSAMLPQWVWREAWDTETIRKACRKANWDVGSYVSHPLDGSGSYVSHPEIRVEVDTLYSSDSVHLSAKGHQVFLEA